MISILDVTLRDGGYVNNHQFSTDDCRGIVRHLSAARIPFIEVGYFRTVNPNYRDRKGPVVCDPEYLDALREESGDSQLAVMVRLGDIHPSHISRLVASGVRMVRFPVTTRSLEDVRPYVEAARQHGLLTAVNLIRASESTMDDILLWGASVEAMGADWMYVADSNGNLLPHQVARIFEALSGRLQVKLALHPHDGLSLAFANTLEACRTGARLIDASLGGVGKNGNLSIELIAMYLNVYRGTSYDLKSLVDATAQYIVKMLGAQCVLRNEYAAASILNLNIDNLSEVTKTSREEGRPVLDLLVEAVQARATRTKEETNDANYGRVSEDFGRYDSEPQEDDESAVSSHFSR